MADRESLSALFDGETTDYAPLLNRLMADPDWQATWVRYHLISETIKNALPNTLSTDFATRVAAAVDREPIPVRPLPIRPNALPAWYKPLTGFALAASVALVTIFGVRLWHKYLPEEPEGWVSQAPASIPPTALVTAASPPRTVEVSAVPTVPTHSRLNDYWINHNEYASFNSVSSVLPHARLVGSQPPRESQ